jgi:hypothetical protein
MNTARRTLAFAAAAVALVALAAPRPAAASWCTASGIFSSCRADCGPGETPVCSVSWLGFSVSCTCVKNAVPSHLGMSLNVGASQEIAFASYLDLLADLGSREAEAVAAAAETMQEVARAGAVDAYRAAVAAHQQALAELSEEELDAVADWADRGDADADAASAEASPAAP